MRLRPSQRGEPKGRELALERAQVLTPQGEVLEQVPRAVPVLGMNGLERLGGTAEGIVQ
jgi:hypothetical protein